MRVNLFLSFFIFVFLISCCLAICEPNQININTAQLNDLMKIKWLGGTGVVAQRVIESRPFNSIDELSKVTGLGGKGSRLNDIKTQGLACVELERSSNAPISKNTVAESPQASEEETPEIIESKVTSQVIKEVEIIKEDNPVPSVEEINLEPKEEPSESIINLNSETNNIKEKVIYESRNEIIRKYAIYAFVIFLSIVIIFLLLMKNGRAKDYSNDDY